MQQRRYQIESIDAGTYIIMDKDGGTCHLLLISEIQTRLTNVQISIVSVADGGKMKNEGYVEFEKETLSFAFYAANWPQVVSVVTDIIQQLHAGTDVTNPAELVTMFGGTLLGQCVQWKPTNTKELN